MAEYTYDDVIIDPNDPRVEIGETYYAATSISSTLRAANAGNESFLVKLDSVNREPTRTIITSKPFTVSYKQGNGGDTDFIIRKKAATYIEQQDEWIKTYNVQVGDKVRVIRKAKTNENGWGDVWDCEYMDPSVNKVLEVVETKGIAGISLDCGRVNCCFPYFVLEKVEEPVFKVGDFVKEKRTGLVGVITRKTEEGFAVYQNNPNVVLIIEAEELEPAKAHIEPFNLSDSRTRDRIIGCRINPKDKEEIDECMIVGFHSYEKGLIDLGISCNGFLSPKDALSLWTFLDGSPCGIVVEDEE